MKKIQLLAAALLISGGAFAQTTANSKPAAQSKAAVTRAVPVTTQIAADLRSSSGSIDNESFMQQSGNGNYGNVDQLGRDNVADMFQTGNGNDAYQRQRGGGVAGGENVAHSTQIGNDNYVDQDQDGYRNSAIVTQGNSPLLLGSRARNENYAVQDQDGSNNYGNIDQDSDSNFAHQKQDGTGNFARTGQGTVGSILGLIPVSDPASNGQWSQTIQTGNNNVSVVSQDHQ